MDRGQAFKFEYIGNTMVKKLDGLVSVQKMLRDMYAMHRKCDSKDRQQREITSTVLQTTDEGLYIRFRRKNTRSDEEVFYSAPSILLWEAVRFKHIAADKKGKQIDAAFEPLEKDPTMKPMNLFSSLDKKYHFLLPLTHPALFLCVLRRPAVRGAKPVTDLHVWRCMDNEEALEMNMLLDRVQTLYSANQSKRTAFFDNSMRPAAPKVPVVMDDTVIDRKGNVNNVPLNQNMQRSHTFMAEPSNKPSYAKSMLNISPSYGGDEFKPASNYGSNERALQDRQRRDRDNDLAPWDRAPPHMRGGGGGSSGEDSDTETTQWQFQPTGATGGEGGKKGKSVIAGPTYGGGLSKSKSMINGRSGSSELLSSGNKFGGSKDDLDIGLKQQQQQPPPRLPRIALASAANQNRLSYFQDDRDDPVYANRGEPRNYNDSSNYYDDLPVNARRDDVRPKQQSGNGAKDPLYASRSELANNPRQQNNIPSRDDNVYFKQNDFLPLPNKTDPMYGKLPQSVSSGPRSLEQSEPVYAVANKRPAVNSNNGQKPPTAEYAPPTKSPQNSDFFFGMTQAKKITAGDDSSVSQTSYNVSNGNGRNRTSPNSTTNKDTTENFYRPTQPQQQQPTSSSNAAADRVARAKQLAAESRLLAQYPDEEPQSRPGFDNEGSGSRDRYPAGPALKMLDTGGGDRPVARIPPHKSQGLSVLPSSGSGRDRDFEKSPTSAVPKTPFAPAPVSDFNDDRNGNNSRAGAGVVQREQGFHRANAEHARSGQSRGQVQDQNGNNSRESNNLYVKNPNSNGVGIERAKSARNLSSNYDINNSGNRKQPTASKGYELPADGGMENSTQTQKKRAEIAAVMDDIEVDNMRRTMKPLGRVNLEESLGYFP